MTIRLPFDHRAIEELCRKHGIIELSFFGSVLRDDFRDESDVDVLVTFASDRRPGLFDLVAIEEQIGGILGRKVDLVERANVERSENYIRRRHILEHTERVYMA